MSVTDRDGPTSERMARCFVTSLLGDGEWEVGGVLFAKHFESKRLSWAHKEYEQVHALPEGERVRDLMERSGLDGSNSKTT